ncbi:hypothetical protein Tsubulata_042772 [Turnera subulata]|uniref:Late embryogenesis abundant protein LEA-2 subgroup domain-containing protein n=1 Tax=Turnera subulata TaxID=218843 RepID=A0A9Q0G5A9_9ROSI|nr:hypothetical protein Tsubulata_042772 [Turnera subulata]
MAPTAAQPQRPAPASSRLFRLIAIVILALIVIVGLAVLITWLVLKPKQLAYSIENRSIHNFNIQNDHLNATFDFLLRAKNPNHKISVYYDLLEVSVAVDGQTLAFNTLEPFHQPRRNVTHLEAHLEARDVALSRSMSKNLRVSKASGDVDLDVRVRARIRLKVGIWKLKHRTLKVLCSPVLVHFSSWKTYDTTDCDIDY